jgi:Ca-activated chloride channel family protein
MFRFAHPVFLYLLSVLPVLFLIYLYFIYKKKSNLKKFGNPQTLKLLMPDVSHKRQYLKFWFLFAGIALIILILAAPQSGSKLVSVKKQGIEVIICLDVSNSMLAEDITPSRLEKSKQTLSRLVDGFSNDKVGLIVFAGEAYIQLPITSDYTAAKMFISSINPQMVARQGTAIGAAISLAVNSFSTNETSEKTVIIITDGENHEDDAVGAATAAVEKGIKINVVGIGTADGAPVPIQPGSNNFRRDADGNVVVSNLNEDMCQQIAAAGKGIYVQADNGNKALQILQKELNKLNKTELESKVYSEYEEQFQILAWIALVLLVWDFFILERKSRIYRKIKLFS